MRYLLVLLAACGTEERTTAFNTPMAPLSAKAERASATIRVHYPQPVQLRGAAPLSWERSADVNGDYTIALDAPVEFKPMLGDKWALGPNYRVAPGQVLDVYPSFNGDKGKVTLLFDGFRSNILGNDRPVYAYTPPGYDDNPEQTFPVVYMHDGQNLFDPNLAFGGNEWKADETADMGVKDGWLRQVIIIGVGNTAQRMREYTPTGDGDKYIQFLVDELMPEVNKALRTKTGPQDTAIIGSSLGGLISAYAGIARADVFGLVGAMSPSTWYADRQIIGAVKASTGRPLKVWVDSGNAGNSNDDVDNTRDLAQAYRDIGYVDEQTLKYFVQDGASHNEVFWSQRLPDALQFLLTRGQ